VDGDLCTECGRKPVEAGRTTCFRCRVATVGFTYRSAHLGRAGFHESTVEAEKRDLFEHAKKFNLDIERVR
jgi:hypothetical protein